MEIRTLIVDDAEGWRRFSRATLEQEPGLQIIGEASDGWLAVQRAGELQPDLILLDIGLPGLNGLEAALQIRKLSPNSRILFMSVERSGDIARQGLRLGACGYLVKSGAGSELRKAVRAVLEGKVFLSVGLDLPLEREDSVVAANSWLDGETARYSQTRLAGH